MSTGGDGKVPVSVVIAARDEGAEIAECIASVAWAREIIVVENDSGDNTVSKARAAGATVFSHPFRSIGAQRNAAIARANEAWILVVDADERGTAELQKEVAAIVAHQKGDYGAYRAPRRNFFMGREIRHGGWERDRPVRLFPRTLRYDERPVHEHVMTGDARVGMLRAPLLHTPYASLDEYFEKLVRYSRWWAQQAHAAGRRCSLGDLLLRPVARVVSMFLLRAGWRDGVHGAALAALAGMSVAGKYVQLWGMQRVGGGATRGNGAMRAPSEGETARGDAGAPVAGAARAAGDGGAPPTSIS